MFITCWNYWLSWSLSPFCTGWPRPLEYKPRNRKEEWTIDCSLSSPESLNDVRSYFERNGFPSHRNLLLWQLNVFSLLFRLICLLLHSLHSVIQPPETFSDGEALSILSRKNWCSSILTSKLLESNYIGSATMPFSIKKVASMAFEQVCGNFHTHPSSFSKVDLCELHISDLYYLLLV